MAIFRLSVSNLQYFSLFIVDPFYRKSVTVMSFMSCKTVNTANILPLQLIMLLKLFLAFGVEG